MIEKFNGISHREKALSITAFISLLLYISYVGLFAPLSGMVAESSAKLKSLEEKLSSIEGETGTVGRMQKELDELKRELKRKEDTEQAFNRQLKEPGQADSVIRLFEESAGDVRVELTRVSIRNSGNSSSGYKNSDKFIRNLKTTPLADKGVEEIDAEMVSYRSNKIDLAYRSNYKNAIEYLEKLRDLPYAISLVTVNITPEENKRGNRGDGTEMILTTRIGMDIYSR